MAAGSLLHQGVLLGVSSAWLSQVFGFAFIDARPSLAEYVGVLPETPCQHANDRCKS